MKIYHYVNLLFLFVIAQAISQEIGPQINFDTTTIDYGTIENNSDGERIFIFSNTGNAPLIIKNVTIKLWMYSSKKAERSNCSGRIKRNYCSL